MTYGEAIAIYRKHPVAVSTKCVAAPRLPAADSFPYVCNALGIVMLGDCFWFRFNGFPQLCRCPSALLLGRSDVRSRILIFQLSPHPAPLLHWLMGFPPSNVDYLQG